MTTALKQLILFYFFIFISAFIMSLSILFFPFLDEISRFNYFKLILSLYSFFFPVFFLVSFFKLGNRK